MKAGYTEGDLRAFLDRELQPGDRDRVAEHLAGCGECDLRLREIESRAERVAAALAGLSEAVWPGRAQTPIPRGRLWPRWAAAGALAAALAVLLVTPRVRPPAPPAVA